MIAAGMTRLPGALAPRRAGAQIVRIKLVKAAAAQAQFCAGFGDGKQFLAKAGEDIADERRGVTPLELLVFFSSRQE